MGKCLIQCPHCGHQANAKEELIGRKTRCPECQRVFTIERADIPETEEQIAEKIMKHNGTSEEGEKEEEEVLGTCPVCNSDFRLYRTQLGEEIECPYCRETVVIETEKIIEHHCPFCGASIKEGAEVCKNCHKPINQLSEAFAWGKPAALCGIGLVLFGVLELILQKKSDFFNGVMTKSFGNGDKITLLPGTFSLIAFVLTASIVYGLSGKFKPGLHSESPVLTEKVQLIIFLVMLTAGGLVTFYVPVMGYLIIFLMVFALTAESAYLPVIGRMDPELLKQWTTTGNQSKAESKDLTWAKLIPLLFPLLTFLKTFRKPGAQEPAEPAEPAVPEVPDAPLQTKCPYCGTAFDIQPEWVGQNAECPECHKEFTIQ